MRCSLKPKNQPMEHLPRCAIPLKTLWMCILWFLHTLSGVLSTKFGHVRYILIIVCNKRHGTQPVLHSSVRLPLHHPSVLTLHNARVTRSQTACLGSLRSCAQPPAIHPVCLAHCADQQPPASCRPNITAALGRYSGELPLMYGGATFEIKSCSFRYPGGIHLQYRSYKWRTDALQILYGRATDAYRA